MTQYGLPFDGVLLGDATKAPYSATEWARQWKLRHGVGTAFPNYGVFAGSGDGTYIPLQVNETNPVSSNVQIQIGAALIDGHFYESTAVEILAINANASGNARIDTVVLRLDYTGQTVRLAVKQGTPAASPARPTLQQDSSFWEIPIADIAVANGFTTLAQVTITQRQRVAQTSFSGWQPYAYPLHFLVAGSYDSSALGIAANGGSVALPVVLSANMLLESIAVRCTSPSTNYEFGWDIYAQDANDGNTSENTLRRIARSNGNATGTTGGSASTLTLAAMGGTAVLSPGIYWVVWQNRHATTVITIGQITTGTSFGNTGKSKSTTNPNGGTLDFATGWSNVTSVVAMRLNGRVFGQTAIF